MKLVPNRTTHFRWMLSTKEGVVTENRVYPIVEWRGEAYYFLNDRGGLIQWSSPFSIGVEDCSFEINLDKVLD